MLCMNLLARKCIHTLLPLSFIINNNKNPFIKTEIRKTIEVL